jgi:ABC transporter substrate binding protein
LLQATRAVPIVFISIPDPVGAGYVDSLARPGGNTTGFVTGRALATVHRDLIITLAVPDTNYPRSTSNASSSPAAACSPMDLVLWISSAARPATSIASSRARCAPYDVSEGVP